MIAEQLPDVVNPRPDVSKAFGDLTKAMAAPRQVQVKFEWVSSASTPNAAPDKNMETLTIIAEEAARLRPAAGTCEMGWAGRKPSLFWRT